MNIINCTTITLSRYNYTITTQVVAITIRVCKKVALTPKVLNSSSQIRFYDNMEEKYIIVDANKLHNRRQRQLLYDNIHIYKLILIEVFKKNRLNILIHSVF